MTTIRATCPDCGEVDMAPRDLTLHVSQTASCYRFECPSCRVLVEKPADRRIAALLLSAGVVMIEPARMHLEGFPPFTGEDVRTFARLLEDDGFLARLASG